MNWKLLAAGAALVWAGGCESLPAAANWMGARDAAQEASSETSPAFEAEILRSAYGVPHIIAADHGGLGYGLGYAAAQDNICEIADRVVTVRGERAAFRCRIAERQHRVGPVPSRRGQRGGGGSLSERSGRSSRYAQRRGAGLRSGLCGRH